MYILFHLKNIVLNVGKQIKLVEHRSRQIIENLFHIALISGVCGYVTFSYDYPKVKGASSGNFLPLSNNFFPPKLSK